MEWGEKCDATNRHWHVNVNVKEAQKDAPGRAPSAPALNSSLTATTINKRHILPLGLLSVPSSEAGLCILNAKRMT